MATWASLEVVLVRDTVNPSAAIAANLPLVGDLNQQAYVVHGTCSEDGRVSLTVGAESLASDCVSGEWQVSAIDLSTVSDGDTIELSASMTDVAGNQQVDPVTSSVTKTLATASVSIDSLPIMTTLNRAAYRVSGTCQNHTGAVNVELGTITAATPPLCNAGTWSVEVDASGESESVQIPVRAELDGVSDTFALAYIAMDVILPVVSFVADHPIVNSINQSTYPFRGSCDEDGQAVTVTFGAISARGVCEEGAWRVGMDFSALVDTDVILGITADMDDSAGNHAVQARLQLVRDVTAPVVSVSSSPSVNMQNAATYRLKGSCSENERQVSITVGSEPAHTVSCDSGDWSWQTSLFEQGSNVIVVEQTDIAGNRGEVTASLNVDTQAPYVELLSSRIINQETESSYALKGVCSELGRDVGISINGGAVERVPCQQFSWELATFSPASYANTTFVVRMEQTDPSQNSSHKARSITSDVVSPEVAFADNLPVISSVNQATYRLSGSCSEDGEVSVTVSPTSTLTTRCENGGWAQEVDFGFVADGESAIVSAVMTDEVQNSGESVSITLDKDTLAIAVSLDTAGSINIANQSSYELSGSCSQETGVVTVSVGGVSPETPPSCSDQGRWSAAVDVQSIGEGEVAIAVSFAEGQATDDLHCNQGCDASYGKYRRRFAYDKSRQ